MKIACILFNNLTPLDLVGVYDAVGRLETLNYIPALQRALCSLTETVSDGRGFTFLPAKVNGSLETYDALIVPRGDGHKT